MKFLVLYEMPIAGLDDWMKTPETERKVAEEKMQKEWQEWTATNKANIIETNAAGKNKRATTGGISDLKNDVMMYSIVEAESPEAAAKMFEKHPHLGIPNAWIDIMPSRDINSMRQ